MAVIDWTTERVVAMPTPSAPPRARAPFTTPMIAISTANGAQVTPQVAVRPTGILMGLESTAHPFKQHPVYMEIVGLPLAERVARMRDPAFRQRVLEAKIDFSDPLLVSPRITSSTSR